MYFTGFADEAADGIDGQIRAVQALGWKNLESRAVDGRNIHDLADEEFERVAGALEAGGVQVNCFGSAIANWGKQISDPDDASQAELDRAIPRMQQLGARLVRIMSYAVLPDRPPEEQMFEERVRRLRTIVARLKDAGIQAVHENCMNYGGMGWPYTLQLLESVPGLQLVFDTGNPVFSADRSRPEPCPRQSSWEFYCHVREHIAYVHIKDGVYDSATSKTRFTFPGEGEGDVRRILADLLQRGYEGGVSIEPHLKVVYHEREQSGNGNARFDTFVEYGRRLEAMVKGLVAGSATAS